MKKKFEFSKLLVLLAVIIIISIAIYSIINYYILTELAITKNSYILPDSDIPVVCITTILGAILSYCLYQFGLKNSRNKFGIDENGQPFKEAVTLVDVIEEFPEQTPKDCEYKED